MIVQAAVLIVTIVLALVDSSSWPVAFFYITMVCVVILNMAAGTYQNLSWATAAKLPMKYTNAVMIGCNSVNSMHTYSNVMTDGFVSCDRVEQCFRSL
jgi:equilibrative nucleoside transporter 1/2/3